MFVVCHVTLFLCRALLLRRCCHAVAAAAMPYDTLIALLPLHAIT